MAAEEDRSGGEKDKADWFLRKSFFQRRENERGRLESDLSARYANNSDADQSDMSGASTASSRASVVTRLDSGEVKSISGSLRRRGTWNSWKDIFVIVDVGVLFEFRHRKSSKPSKVITLKNYGIRFAEQLTGEPFSFGLFSRRKSPIFYLCSSHGELVKWVQCLKLYCTNAELEWKEDEVLEAFNDPVIMATETGLIVGMNTAALYFFGYTRSELMGNSVVVLMPPEIGKHHSKYMAKYLETNEKRLIGKPRKFQAVHKSGKRINIELSLGEMTHEGERKFLARFRSAGSPGDEGASGGPDYVLRTSIEQSVDSVMESMTQEMKKTITSNVLDALNQEIEVAEAKNEKLREELRLLRAERLGSQCDSQSSLTMVSKPSATFSSNARLIELSRVVVHERLAPDGGSGAQVYVCSVDGWQCAMKELNTTGLDEKSKQGFLKEIDFLEKLPPHRNIARYLFHEKSPTTIRLFMTRYSKNLHSFLREHEDFEQPLDSREIVTIGLDIAVGLDYLHKNDILHRDLKTDNIFITKDGMGNFQCAVIGDMDAARRLMHGSKAQTVVGTPGYMAPEILRSNTYSYPCDVWSLGIILWELLIAARPGAESFDPCDGPEVLSSPNLPFLLKADFEGLLVVIRKCLHKKPKKRPSATEVKQQLLMLTIE